MTELRVLPALQGLLDAPDGAPAFVGRDGTTTYGDLRRAAAGYARHVRDRGVAAGGAALVCAPDGVDTVVAVLGAWSAGLVPAVVSADLSEQELAAVVATARPALVHAAPGHVLRRLTERALAVDPQEVTPADEVTVVPLPEADGPVLVQYTSGSTGGPKAVQHGARGIAAVLRGFGSVLALQPGDLVLSAAKLSFGYGFGNSLLFPLAAGATAVLDPEPLTLPALGRLLEAHRPSVLCLVPRLLLGLVRAAELGRPADLRGVRTLVSAGEHLPAELAADVERLYGLTPVNGLGATEVLHIVVSTGPGDARAGLTGRAVPGVRVTVRDDDGRVVPDGEQGRLHVAGDCVALGYGGSAPQDRVFADGGAYTGDLARMDDGVVQYLCRADDMLVVGGFRYPPHVVESPLRRVAGVRDVAVVPATGPGGLQSSVAYVETDGTVADDALAHAVRRALAALPLHQQCERVEVVPALPRTSTGKLARREVRALATT